MKRKLAHGNCGTSIDLRDLSFLPAMVGKEARADFLSEPSDSTPSPIPSKPDPSTAANCGVDEVSLGLVFSEESRSDC